MEWLYYLLSAIGGIVVGLVVGFFITKKIFERQIEKNPPITREQVKMMYKQMGRTPSEKDINRIMDTMSPKKNVKK